ncbi:alpha/beta-type small acid-soluble spore protein [Serpentinicella sp. ANB-PHB4]|uniref:alpha/beta-type small acid-soluble spore protein n=1 Tax=Serpentinicella sp. ANB-PHB4 TaxID=3074076 RepID=UPI0028614443|nr:alpha/beta-type small acid-soluble spore protein [Serpentinicella sp. ANB-PHB4]MDR5658705.1 alpha/beta-type small acid-soluble spore protein [Serpentinicella sp. ANB-PHB4]
MSNRKNPVVPEAKQALNSFKMEIAKELGLENETPAGYVGGQMVKKMVEEAEKSLIHLGRS